MKFTSSSYNVGYPVYGAKFLNDSMLLVAGGGGEGNNGIPNKLTVLRVNFEKTKVIKRFREITLDPNDDSPTTLDAANDLILMGCNENSEKIKSGQSNQHLRKFVYEEEHLKFVASVDFDGSRSPDDYTKLIYMSHDGSVGALASSKTPTVIRVIDPGSLEEKYEIETGHDVKDMHFAPDGKVIGYITASTLEVISIVTGRFIIRKIDFDKNYILSKIRFLTDDVLLIAASLKTGSGIIMIKISLKSGSASVLKTKMITTKFKGVTSMDVDPKSQLAALAGNDNSIALIKLRDLSVGKIFKQVHNFAITRVCFSPNSKYVASVSAANTVNVMNIPDKFASSTSIAKKMWKLFVNFVLIVMIAALGQLAYKYDVGNKVFTFTKNQYIARRQKSGAIDILKQTTLVGDIVSQQTSTRPQSTAESAVETAAFLTENVAGGGADAPNDDLWLSEVLSSVGYESQVAESVEASTPAVEKAKATPLTTQEIPQDSRMEPSLTSEKSTDGSEPFDSETEIYQKHSSKHPSGEQIESKSFAESSQISTDVTGTASNIASGSASAPDRITREASSVGSTSPKMSSAEKGSSSAYSVSVISSSWANEVSDMPTHEVSQYATHSTQTQPSFKSELPDMPLEEMSTNMEATSTNAIESKSSHTSSELAPRVAEEVIPSVSESSSISLSSDNPLSSVSASSSVKQESRVNSADETIPYIATSSAQLEPSSIAKFGSVTSSPSITGNLESNDILQPSNVEVGGALLEEKTPEPTKEVGGGGEELTTPGDDLVSSAQSTEDEIALPSDVVSLKTGKDYEHKNPASRQKDVDQVREREELEADQPEIQIYVEVPAEALPSSEPIHEGTGKASALGEPLQFSEDEPLTHLDDLTIASSESDEKSASGVGISEYKELTTSSSTLREEVNDQASVSKPAAPKQTEANSAGSATNTNTGLSPTADHDVHDEL